MEKRTHKQFSSKRNNRFIIKNVNQECIKKVNGVTGN